MKWIPMGNRLPPYAQVVWLTDGEGIEAGWRECTDQHGEHYQCMDGERYLGATHWMPQPALPGIEP